MPHHRSINLGYPLELSRNSICLFMGFRPSEYSCPQWILVENFPPSFGTYVLGCSWPGNDKLLCVSTVVRRSSHRKYLQRWIIKLISTLMHPIYRRILNHKILTLDRGWTKSHGYFIQMGGFMLYEGDVAKGVLSPERFSKLLTAEKIEFPTVTVEEIEDRSKSDEFSKTIALSQTLWFVTQCISRRAQHLDLTLIELLTLSLAVFNGFMYFLWWHKPLNVRCPVRVYLLPVDAPNESNESNVPILDPQEPGEFYWSLDD